VKECAWRRKLPGGRVTERRGRVFGEKRRGEGSSGLLPYRKKREEERKIKKPGDTKVQDRPRVANRRNSQKRRKERVFSLYGKKISEGWEKLNAVTATRLGKEGTQKKAKGSDLH